MHRPTELPPACEHSRVYYLVHLQPSDFFDLDLEGGRTFGMMVKVCEHCGLSLGKVNIMRDITIKIHTVAELYERLENEGK